MILPKTMPKPDYIAISLVRSKGVTALIIHFGMFLYAILRLLKPKRVFNHDEIRFGEYTSGAIGNGITTRKWQDYVDSFEGKYFKHYDYQLHLTDEEWAKGYAYLRRMEGIGYEYANFFYHAIKIFTGIWAGSRSTRQAFCLEHAIRFINATEKYYCDPFSSPYKFEKWADKNLKREMKS